MPKEWKPPAEALEMLEQCEEILKTRPFWKAKNILFKLKLPKTQKNVTIAGMVLRLAGYERYNKTKTAPVWYKPGVAK